MAVSAYFMPQSLVQGVTERKIGEKSGFWEPLIGEI